MWCSPIRKLSVPVGRGHPGAFGAVRKHDIHTGVDLYAPEKTLVFPVEDGEVVAFGQFTGEKLGFPWWEDTDYIAIKGLSGVVLYGELSLHNPFIGEEVLANTRLLGRVKRVMKTDKGRPMSMLHLELYREWRGWTAWEIGQPQPENLLDPTFLLSNALI